MFSPPSNRRLTLDPARCQIDDARGGPWVRTTANYELAVPGSASDAACGLFSQQDRARVGDSAIGTLRQQDEAIVVTDQAAGTAGMMLVERPEPQAAINDVVVQVHASGFVPTELAWPSTWTDRLDRDRTPSIPGHELAGVVTALGYGTRGLSVGQRVFGLADWHRDGTRGKLP